MNSEEKEAIATLNEHLDHWKRLLSEKICDQSESEKTIDALQNAIKALEKEHCEDAISRQAVLDINEHYHGQMPSHVNHEIWKEINALPSVTVQPKIGRWIEHFDESGKWYECDQCHTDWGGSVKYCPNCGAEMRGDAE